MAREAVHLRFNIAERELLQQLVQAHSTPQGLAFRARLVLRCAAADHPTNQQVAQEFHCTPETVARWRRRFHDQRLQGLHDRPRSGRPVAFSPRRAAPSVGVGHHAPR